MIGIAARVLTALNLWDDIKAIAKWCLAIVLFMMVALTSWWSWQMNVLLLAINAADAAGSVVIGAAGSIGALLGPVVGAMLPEPPAGQWDAMVNAAQNAPCAFPGPVWLAALAFYESNYGANPGPSSAGAWGYGQFMPDTLTAYGISRDQALDYRVMLPAMTTYLCRAGIASNIDQAFYSYNHSLEYVAHIRALVASWGRASAAPQIDISVVLSGPYAFPVVGYAGKIELHWGVYPGAADIFGQPGTPIVAMRGGRVAGTGIAGTPSGGPGGNWVMIQGDDNLVYYYAHLADAPLVRGNQKIPAGTQLGYLGKTGNAEAVGYHLHIGIGAKILDGTGPTGGAGADGFDAVGLLRRVLAATLSVPNPNAA